MREIEITTQGVFDTIGNVFKILFALFLGVLITSMVAVLGWATLFSVTWTLRKVATVLVVIAALAAALTLLGLGMIKIINLYEKNPTLLKFGGVKLAKAKVRKE